MTLHPRLSKAAIELVKSFEGLRRKAARLDNGGWTIGYGHTLSAREGAEVTAEEAEALLLYDLDKTARAVDALVVKALNTNQFAALTAFAFNVGLENFKTSLVLDRVNNGQYFHAANAMELWRRAEAGGDTFLVDGLVRRRAAEKALFLTPPEGFKPVSTPVLRVMLDGGEFRGVVDLWTPLQGDLASAERYEAPGAATTEAIRNVTAHLQSLFPNDDNAQPSSAELGVDALTAPEPEVQPEAEPAPFEAAPEVQPESAPAPEVAVQAPPELAPPLAPVRAPPVEPMLQPAPTYEPDATPEAEPPPPADTEPPPPPLFETGRHVIDPDELPEGFGRRPVAFDVDAKSIFAPKGAPAPAPRLHAPVVLLVGLGGAILFVGSLIAMIYGEASLTNLVIGLLGVICMAPAGLKLLLKLFGERSSDQDV